jgi:DNA-binding NarL/FixJ family response regulator
LQHLLTAVCQVGDGLTWYVQQEAVSSVKSSSAEVLPLSGSMCLTKRETEIARRLLRGMTTPEISDQLGITDNTVETHRHSILKKLKCKNTRALVNFQTAQWPA